MKKIAILLLLLNFILLPSVLSQSGHMKLLAVRESENGTFEGGIADLYLEIRPGSGRVFLETFPLTKTDTQMSTRFAKAIACDEIERDCDDVDFFYTITADSAIIAGPSAGSSIAVLTVAVLEDLKLDEGIAATGTINSGGLVGPVGGLKAKVEAAKASGLKKVLIPAGEIVIRVDNATVDLNNLSRQLGIEIIEVSTLSEAVKHFTGKEISQKFRSLEISEEYKSTMKGLAKGLCDRSADLKSGASASNYSMNVTLIKENAKNLTGRGREAFEKQTFYSSASYCFGANVEYSTLIILSRNLSKQEAIKEIEKIKNEIGDFRNRLSSSERKTITDLEAYIVVKERLDDAEKSADDALELLESTNRTDSIARMLAYASERVNSAYSWATFLGKNGKEFVINNDILKKSCQSKISEAQERVQYVELYLPGALGGINEEIEKATGELKSGNYETCLSQASKAKADVDVILSLFGVDSEQYDDLLERKLDIVKNSIAEQTAKGVFPILSYSYYEYANSLKGTDISSALLYSEYALELSNLDIYFRESSSQQGKKIKIDEKLLGIFLLGVMIGLASSYFIRTCVLKSAKAKKKKRK